MIATLDEWQAARAHLDAVVAELGAAGISSSRRLEIGIMVEVPAAALRIADFAAEVDFFSIGSNDLGQYLFAAERGNASVAALGDSYQPALLGLIGDIVRDAHQAGRPVALCGELAGDLALVPILVGLGLDELSVHPVAITTVARAIRRTSGGEAARLAETVRGFTSARTVRARLK